jgi:anaerobic ribonucleoside-triphosphate reductase activating protein
MRIAKIINDSIVDGPGFRYTVFVQGCRRNCPGCHNPDTHDPAGGYDESIENMIAEIRKNPLLDGLTISGGEPFLQADGCAKLAWLARRQRKSVWVYTGYTYEEVLTRKEFLPLLEETDVLVDGPFIESEKSYELHFRGSRNQRLVNVPASLEAGETVLWKEKRRHYEDCE